jgi:hypothetical protein
MLRLQLRLVLMLQLIIFRWNTDGYLGLIERLFNDPPHNNLPNSLAASQTTTQSPY